jgi:hypothetical protein
VRCRASGVRSSCEALATNWRWDRKDAYGRYPWQVLDRIPAALVSSR